MRKWLMPAIFGVALLMVGSGDSDAQWVSGGSSGSGGSPGGSTNDIQYKSGASTFGGITLTNGQLVVGQTGSTPLATTISGDATLNAAGALTVSTIGGLTPGTGAFSSPPTSNAIGWDGAQFIVSPSVCPTGIETWDGTAAKTIAATTGLLYTTGSTQIAAARVLTLPTVASYVLNCSLTVVDLAGIFNATNLVTPTRASSDTIDGATTGTTLGGPHQSVAYKPAAAGLWATTIAPSIPADTAVSNQFVTSIPATGIITRAQPAFTNISGTAAVAQGGTGLTSGTSGGVLAYTASGTLASSAALTANLPVIGGGAGVAPSVGTRSGNTTRFVSMDASTPATNDCAKFDANLNLTTAGAACGSGGSGTTVVSAVSTAQLDKTSDTALANITGLTLALTAAKTYVCHGAIYATTNASGGFKIALADSGTGGPLTVTSIRYGVASINAGNIFNSTTTLGTGVGGNGALGTNGWATIEATIVVNAGGNLAVQAAQNTSNGTTTSFLVNSYLSCVQQN